MLNLLCQSTRAGKRYKQIKCAIIIVRGPLELSPYVLEIPNDAYTTRLYNILSKSDWLFSTKSRVIQAAQLRFESSEKAALNINMPQLSLFWCIDIFKTQPFKKRWSSLSLKGFAFDLQYYVYVRGAIRSTNVCQTCETHMNCINHGLSWYYQAPHNQNYKYRKRPRLHSKFISHQHYKPIKEVCNLQLELCLL